MFVQPSRGGSPTPPCVGPIGRIDSPPIRGVARAGRRSSGVPTSPIGKWVMRQAMLYRRRCFNKRATPPIAISPCVLRSAPALGPINLATRSLHDLCGVCYPTFNILASPVPMVPPISRVPSSVVAKHRGPSLILFDKLHKSRRTELGRQSKFQKVIKALKAVCIKMSKPKRGIKRL